MLKANTLVRKAEGTSVEEIDGEIVVFREGACRLATLNCTASEIWHLIRDGTSIENIVVCLAEKYRNEVEPAQLFEDVCATVSALANGGFLVCFDDSSCTENNEVDVSV